MIFHVLNKFSVILLCFMDIFSKMLTGLLEPSSGSISVMGHDLRTGWSEAQKVIGLCPQQSVLYDALTPKEHLVFYGRLKGNLNGKDVDEDVDRFHLSFVDLRNFPLQ